MIKNYARVFFLFNEIETCIPYIILDKAKQETLVSRTFAICDI